MAATLVFQQVHKSLLNSAGVVSFGFEYLFTDASPATGITQTTSEEFSGSIAAVNVYFDDTTPPNSLTVTISDKYGLELISDTLTATGTIDLISGPVSILPGALQIAISGNTTASAVAKIVLVMF